MGVNLIDLIEKMFNREQQFTGFKAIGDGLWIAAHTNNLEDRDQEILTHKAHERYVARVNSGLVDMPELWHWHMKGTRYGQAKWLGHVGHVVVAVGTFDDTPVGQAAEAHLKKNAKDYELSHGFTFPVWAFDGKHYVDYNTFEISTLPKGKASNRYTPFTVIQEDLMPVTDEQRLSLEAMFGDKAAEILQHVESAEKTVNKAVELGARYKDFSDVTEQPEAETEKQAAPAIDTSVLGMLFEAQGAIVEKQDGLVTLIDNALGKLEKGLAQIESVSKELKLRIEEKPQPVDSTQANVVEDEKAKQVEAVIEQQQKAVEIDPFWGSAQVKRG